MDQSERRPLAVTADEELLDDLVRLAAAAGVELEVVHEPGGARRSWATAPLILIGQDQAAGLADAAPTRRRDVVVVTRSYKQSSHDDPWRAAVAIGADDVVALPDAEGWLVDRLADAAEGPGQDAVVIGVIGGRGGAGASTLAAALGVTSSKRGAATLLMDTDRLGGGVDLVLGGEDAVGLRWPRLAGTRGRVSGAALRAALPRVADLAVLSWDGGDASPIEPETMRAVLSAARRAHEVVVVDLPRHVDDAAVEALTRCSVVLLVVPAEVRAVAAADRIGALVRAAPDVRLVVRGPSPAGLDGATVAAALNLPLAAMLPPEPRLAAMLERGAAPAQNGKGPLAAFCREFLDTRRPMDTAA